MDDHTLQRALEYPFHLSTSLVLTIALMAVLQQPGLFNVILVLSVLG